MKKYYVYVYLDPRKFGKFIYAKHSFNNEPFYVGKGQGDRFLKHLKETTTNTENPFKHRVISKILKLELSPIIIKIKENLTEKEAYELEKNLIFIIGKRFDKSGPLTNICSDSRPPSNYKKLSKKNINKIINLYNSGMHLKHIGRIIGVGELKIKRVLIENNINPIRRPPLNKVFLEKSLIDNIVKDYINGFSIRKLRDKYKLSISVIRRNLEENNIIYRGYDYPRTKEHIDNIVKTRKKSNLVGEKCKSYIKLDTSTRNLIFTMRSEKMCTLQEICDQTGLSMQKVYTTLIELNLSTKKIRNNGRTRIKKSKN